MSLKSVPPYSHPGNLWRHCRLWQGCFCLPVREESWQTSANKVCGILQRVLLDVLLGLKFVLLFCAPCDELHWTCSLLHIFIWIVVEQTICFYAHLQQIVFCWKCLFTYFAFLVLYLHSFTFNQNSWPETYFVSIRKVKVLLPD